MKGAGLAAWVVLSIVATHAQAASFMEAETAAATRTAPRPPAVASTPDKAPSSELSAAAVPEAPRAGSVDRRIPPEVLIVRQSNQEINPSETVEVQSPIVAWLGADWAFYLLGALILLLQAVVIFLMFSQRRRLAMVGSPQTLIEAFADGRHTEMLAQQRAGFINQTQALSRGSATTLVDVLVALYRQVEELKSEVRQLKGGAPDGGAAPAQRSDAFYDEARGDRTFGGALSRAERDAPSEPVIQPRRIRVHDDAPDIFASSAPSQHAGALQALMPHYAAAVRSRKSLVRFAEEREARYVADNRLVEDASSAMLIALPLGGDDFAIVPGPELASNFSSMYDAERSMPEDARRAFHFQADGSRNPKLERAGLGRLSDGLLVILEKGVIGGLRD
ncbi:MAG: hypothetical protein J0M36_00055 [Caulobacterales bacterium]|nr:hypothetical protein [Caulobacterales bacterium]